MATNPDVAANCNIRRTMELTRQMIILADEGEAAARDDGCAVLYGVVRDCAYRIRSEAERERDRHQVAGRWDAAPAS